LYLFLFNLMTMDERRPLLATESLAHYYIEDDGKNKIVNFDPNGDPENPMEWPTWYKWCVVLLLAFMSFTVYVLPKDVAQFARLIVP